VDVSFAIPCLYHTRFRPLVKHIPPRSPDFLFRRPAALPRPSRQPRRICAKVRRPRPAARCPRRGVGENNAVFAIKPPFAPFGQSALAASVAAVEPTVDGAAVKSDGLTVIVPRPGKCCICNIIGPLPRQHFPCHPEFVQKCAAQAPPPQGQALDRGRRNAVLGGKHVGGWKGWFILTYPFSGKLSAMRFLLPVVPSSEQVFPLVACQVSPAAGGASGSVPATSPVKIVGGLVAFFSESPCG